MDSTAESAVLPSLPSAFRLCGDWNLGIARILCPSCAQKRTLLLGEYLSGNLLLNLPHRQFVWTIPKVLRCYLRHDRSLFADAAGRPIQAAMVSSHQT